LARAKREGPRHAIREAGLIITSDLCPVTPGSYTRREASLVISSFSCAFDLTGRVMSFLDLDPANRALALRRGLGDSGVVSWFLRSLLIHATIPVCRRSARAALWTHSTHHDDEGHHRMIVLAPCAVYGRKYLRRATHRKSRISDVLHFTNIGSRASATRLFLRGGRGAG
jgi:hypothetical protein